LVVPIAESVKTTPVERDNRIVFSNLDSSFSTRAISSSPEGEAVGFISYVARTFGKKPPALAGSASVQAVPISDWLGQKMAK